MLLAGEPDLKFHYCSDSATALERANEIDPTVLLQDLVMPGISGLELVQRYRANLATARVPVIVLSGNDDAESRKQALAAGADDYLVKVPKKGDLLACLRRHAGAAGDLK